MKSIERKFLTLTTVILASLIALLNPQRIEAAIPVFSNATNDALQTTSSGRTLSGFALAWIDFNNDGWDDLLEGGTGKLYQNMRDGTFQAVKGVNFAGARGFAIGDYDDDGWDDVLATPMVTLDSEGNLIIIGAVLFRNNGDNTFTDVSESAGVQLLTSTGAKTANFGDIDNDGDLDLYVGSWGTTGNNANKLFRNNLIETGVATYVLITSDIENASGPIFASAMSDYNNDGLLDLILIRDANTGGSALPNFFLNNGQGNFEADANAPIMPIIGMGIAVGDYNQDGLQDYYATGGSGENYFAKNLGNGFFEKVNNETRTLGNGNITDGILRHMWGTAFLDADNDGDLDLYVLAGDSIGTRFYNNVDNSFDEITNVSQTNYSAMSLAIADYDHDGKVDMVIGGATSGLILLRNETPNEGNHWLNIRLNGIASNKRGIGAKITINTSAGTKIQEISSGSSKGDNHSFSAHFGFASDTAVHWMIVKWPSGTIDRIAAPPMDSIITIVEGQGILNAPTIRDVISSTGDFSGLSGKVGGLVYLNGSNFCENQCFSASSTETKIVIGNETIIPLYVQDNFLYFAIPQEASTGVLMVRTHRGSVPANSIFRVIP